MSEPTNKIADLSLKLLKQGRDKVLIPFIIKKAVAKFSWLGLSFINPVFSWIVASLIDIFYDEAILLAFFGITSVQVNHQKNSYNKAVAKLHGKLIQHKGDLNNEEVKQASEDFDKKLFDLINFNM